VALNFATASLRIPSATSPARGGAAQRGLEPGGERGIIRHGRHLSAHGADPRGLLLHQLVRAERLPDSVLEYRRGAPGLALDGTLILGRRPLHLTLGPLGFLLGPPLGPAL
jgi:hypothetical protein